MTTLEILKRYRYAHRGFYDHDTCPENSLAAFERAKINGFGCELDVHLLKDGSLGILHDSNLKRMTGEDILIEDLTKEDLDKYYLAGTEEHIPLLDDVLKLGLPLIVEIKTAGNNYKAVCQKTWQMLSNYKAPFCIESFDPRAVFWFRLHHSDIIRGQLSCDFINDPETVVSESMKKKMTNLAFNFFTKPDFVAYRYKDRNNEYLQKYLDKGGQEVSWTLVSKEELLDAENNDSIPIFEGFNPNEI